MSLDGPYFHAWCDDADRVDAFSTALSALAHPKTWSDETSPISVEEAVAKARADFAAGTSIRADVSSRLSSGRVVLFDLHAYRDGHKGGYHRGPLYLAPDDRRRLLLEELELARGGGERSVEVEAAVLAIQAQQDIEDLMLRLCVPDAHVGVTTGTFTWFWDWGAPIQGCVTFHTDAAQIARDLALSWIHLHDGDKMHLAAGISMNALHARVEAAPRGAHAAVAGDVDLVRQHSEAKLHLFIPIPAHTSSVRGEEIAFKGDAVLTREDVLQALSTPPSLVLDALEASAASPDDEWRAVEVRALETIEATKQGAPAYHTYVDSRRHLQFIQRYAPYHVRRLPNGGVLLATHPYRTLWPLWTDALFLLGTRT